MQDEIRNDVKAIRGDVSDIKTILAVNTESLKAHMARTTANEERINRVEDWALKLLGAIVLAGLLSAVKYVIS
jgi:hypothetical protein